MLDKDAIQELSRAAAIKQANDAIAGVSPIGVISLHNDFNITDLEKFMDARRRARGVMESTSIVSFADYVKANKEPGATVFVDEKLMRAVAVLNLGSAETPGHCDNTAVYACQPTAAYAALKKTASGDPKTQTEIAEFLEDWLSCITSTSSGGDTESAIEPKHAVAAIRSLSIESLRKLENQEQSLSASRSTFDSVKVANAQVPAFIVFKCEPYKELRERSFQLRLGVITAGDKPRLTLRIVKAEEHAEQMAAEVVTKVNSALGNEVPALIGAYTVRP